MTMGYFGDEDENRDLFSTTGGDFYFEEARFALPDIDPEAPLDAYDSPVDDFEDYRDTDDLLDRLEGAYGYGPTHAAGYGYSLIGGEEYDYE